MGFLITAACVDRLQALTEASSTVLWMIFVSSIIGIVVGDNTWLEALRILGTRRVIIVDSLKPFCGALLSSLLLHETIATPWLFYSGMVLTVVGVVICALKQAGADTNTGADAGGEDGGEDGGDEKTGKAVEDGGKGSRNRESNQVATGQDGRILDIELDLTWGYCLAVMNVFLDAIGFVITKHYGTKLNTFDLNLLRFGEAGAMLTVWWGGTKILRQCLHNTEADNKTVGVDCKGAELASEQAQEEGTCLQLGALCAAEVELEASGDGDEKLKVGLEQGQGQGQGQGQEVGVFWGMSREQWVYAAVGVLFVTYCCPALTNYALFEIPLAMTLTMGALGPLYALPLVSALKGEQISPRAIISALITVVGVVMVVLGAQ